MCFKKLVLNKIKKTLRDLESTLAKIENVISLPQKQTSFSNNLNVI